MNFEKKVGGDIEEKFWRTIKIYKFFSPVTARQIRIWPIENGYETEDYKLYKSMRVEIYGCNKDGSEINDGDQDS